LIVEAFQGKKGECYRYPKGVTAHHIVSDLPPSVDNAAERQEKKAVTPEEEEEEAVIHATTSQRTAGYLKAATDYRQRLPGPPAAKRLKRAYA
jgi:hypothetical protein